MRHFYQEAHSPVGGSGAKRWMACPGSVRIIAGDDSVAGDEQEFTAEGIVAHEIVAECLVRGKELWEHAGQERTTGAFTVLVDDEMIEHMQLYLDTVLGALPKDCDVELMIERQVSYAELGVPDAFGTLDCGFVVPCDQADMRDTLHIFDLKFGQGVFVHASDPQFKYYAGAVIATFPELCANVRRIKIWVVQPRIDWAGPKVRTIEMSRDELGTWVADELLPAIEATRAPDAPLVPGPEQCQFCKKQSCPAQKQIVEYLMKPHPGDMHKASDEALGRLYEKWMAVKGLGRSLEQEIYARLTRGRMVPGTKLVEGKTSRVGKPGFEAEAIKRWGNAAYKELEVRSLPQLEKLTGGKKFAQEWGVKPQGQPTLALADDSRPAIGAPRSPQAAFASVLTKRDE